MDRTMLESASRHAAATAEHAADGSPKRQAILDAAETLFMAHGYGAVSMEAVARQGGVSKATLYAYFISKEQLFASIVAERGLNHFLDDSALPDHAPDLRAALQAIGGMSLRFMLRPRTLAIYRIAVAESTRFPELGQAFYENGPHRTMTRLAAWLGNQDLPSLRAPEQLEMATTQFAALLRSCVFMRAALGVPPAPDETEIEATVAAAVDTWLRAFGRPRSTQPA